MSPVEVGVDFLELCVGLLVHSAVMNGRKTDEMNCCVASGTPKCSRVSGSVPFCNRISWLFITTNMSISQHTSINVITSSTGTDIDARDAFFSFILNPTCLFRGVIMCVDDAPMTALCAL